MVDEGPCLVVATTNRGKLRELAELLSGLELRLETLADHPDHVDVVEDGETFSANAEKKAQEQARHMARWVMAEDSGLCVDALDGAPGVYSARFSGASATDELNNSLLLEKLAGVPRARRGAHYVCSIAIADPSGSVRARSEAACHGLITEARRGGAGFGYDPLFEIPEYHRTFGELGDQVKSALSHRARAIVALMPQLSRLLADGHWPAAD